MEQAKIDRALKLLGSYKGSEPIEVSFSGGKDSCVILELTKMAGIPYRAIYKNTTIDPPFTIKFCKDNGVEIIRPKKTFFQLIEHKGFPTMRCRFCCSELKEYKILDNSIQGIRRCESSKRATNYSEPIICRIYGAKKNHVNVFLPILDWSNEDVEQFINERQIRCHPLYYVNGKFDVTKRLGCMCCPLKSGRGLSDFKKNPKMVKAWINHGQIWWQEHQNTKSHKKFESIYDLFVHNLFFDSYNDFKMAKSGMFGSVDCKQYLEDYFKITL
jgi:phosphoadenosine phosphosulfate reductase